MNRYDHLLKTYREQKMRERKERILMKTRSEVNVNGNGTSGYTIQQGPNKDSVAGHITVGHPNTSIK